MGDPYWSNVVFLSGFEGGTAVDESPLGQTVTLHGTAALSSGQAKFGTQSLLSPGASGDGLSVPSHASFLAGTTPYTVEGWFRWDVLKSTHLVGQMDAGTANGLGWQLIYTHGASTGLRFLEFNVQDTSFGYVTTVTANWWPSLSTWYHLATDFDGTTYRLYVDGVMIASDTGDVWTVADSVALLTVGSEPDAGAIGTWNSFDGNIDEVRVTVGAARYADDGGFTAPSAAFERGPDNDVLIEEGVEFLEAFAGLSITDVDENVAMGSTLSLARLATASDTVSVLAFTHDSSASPVVLSVGVGVAPTLQDYQGAVIAEALGLLLTSSPALHYNIAASDELGASDRTATGFMMAVADEVGIELTQLAQHAVKVLEELGLAPVLSPNAVYGLTVAQTIRLADTLGKFVGGDVSETIGMESALAGSMLAMPTIAEVIGVAEAETHYFILRVTVEDELDVEPVELLNMIYSPTVAEEMQLTAAYLSPGASITTWAMNTRTAAVTEYDNYAFNSFARFGNKYIGANADGLYELLGDNDAGNDIVAQIKSGFAQWAGTRFTLFKAAYLGVRGEGDFILRLITGEGDTYDYSVSTRNVRSTKVHMGKGLRARYFAFELISGGQDFDLESIEFVPLVAQRRV